MLKNVNLDENKLIKASETFEIYSDNDNLITENILKNNNEYIKIQNLKEHTKNAFIAVEDRRFYSHNGIDYKRIIGALIKNVKSLSFKEGASTITQQLVKNTQLSSDKTINRKLKEIKLSTQLESIYTKNEILEAYLNTIYFGSGAYGIESASKLYFSKSASELTINESAMLAGIIKSPKNYSPIYENENANKRKNLVLNCMKECGFISDQEYLELKNINVLVNTKTNANYSSNYVNAVLKQYEEFSSFNPYQKGKIKIKTFLDENLQKSISNKITDYDEIKIIINSKNSGINAFYGDFYNLKRSPASCVKPWLVYAPMLNENFIKQSTVINDEEISINGYSPRNFNNKTNGNVTVKKALELSLNIPAVKLVNDFGIDKINVYANKFGLDIKNDGLTCAVGAISGGLSLKELCDIYSVFSSGGYYSKSSFIKEIYQGDKKIYQFKPQKIKVFDSDTVFLVNDMLKSAVKNGTSKILRTLPFEVCAKTGTNGNSKGNIDALSVAYTTDLIIGAWVGNYNEKLMPNSVTGSNEPTKINKNILEYIYKNKKPLNFHKPNNVVESKVDYTELINNQNEFLSSNGESFYYKLGTEPTKELNIKPTLNNVKLTLNNGILRVNLNIYNATNIEIVRIYKGTKTTVYSGKLIYEFSEPLSDFGLYQYQIIAYNNNEKVTFDLPNVNFNISNLYNFNDDLWLKE